MAMQTALNITFDDVPGSEALEQHIRDKVAKLETLFPHLVGCHVTVGLPHKHKTHGKMFEVRIDLKVPGAELAVNHHQDEDPYVALRDAFDAARRRLEDHTRRQRGEVKHHA